MMIEDKDRVVSRGPCPKCTSSDAYILYADGHGHCFSCSYHNTERHGMTTQTQTPVTTNVQPLSNVGKIAAIEDRKISAATCKAYNVRQYDHPVHGS